MKTPTELRAIATATRRAARTAADIEKENTDRKLEEERKLATAAFKKNAPAAIENLVEEAAANGNYWCDYNITNNLGSGDLDEAEQWLCKEYPEFMVEFLEEEYQKSLPGSHCSASALVKHRVTNRNGLPP